MNRTARLASTLLLAVAAAPSSTHDRITILGPPELTDAQRAGLARAAELGVACVEERLGRTVDPAQPLVVALLDHQTMGLRDRSAERLRVAADGSRVEVVLASGGTWPGLPGAWLGHDSDEHVAAGAAAVALARLGLADHPERAAILAAARTRAREQAPPSEPGTEPERPAAAVPPSTPLSTTLRGFCFAHEGYRWIDGYGSQAAARSLQRLAQLGANAVSLTPFGFQRDPARPELVTLHERTERTERTPSPAFGGATETDFAIEITAQDARQLGLVRVLKPHLWCGHGRWCGEIALVDDAAWAEWFAAYERFALHYAELAGKLGLEVFCLGTELVGTTRREAQWRALIAKVRALYPGLLTYCANWGEEVERIPFWDALDVVGISAYWPLADAPGATDEALRRRFREVLARTRRLGEQAQRPVWFLEIGFPDVKEPWLAPHRSEGTPDGGVDQAKAYRIVLEETTRAGFPDGLFFWKWPSILPTPLLPAPPPSPADPGRRHDYWPCGRAAEEVLREAWRGE